MKITIAYTAEEAREAAIMQRFADSLIGGARVRRSGRDLPLKHIYLSTKNPDDATGTKEKGKAKPAIDELTERLKQEARYAEAKKTRA